MILFDAVVAIAPVYAYYAQLALIRKEKSLGSFSIMVCAILLISNILRVFFWLTTGFAVNLLFQSLFIICIQLMLLKECVELIDHPKPASSSYFAHFWKWPTFEQYISFLLGLTASMTVLTLIFQLLNVSMFGDLVGLVSMTIEATLGWPQMYSNWSTKSVKGLSYTMIGMWFLGDFAKTLYFIFEEQPYQFVMCGVVQLTVDVVIILQIARYGKADYAAVQGAHE